MPKLPSFQFYPGDWMKDPAVRSVSLAARGLYVEMLCVMWESEERGVLPYARKAEAKALAKVVGHRRDFVAKLLRELELSRVVSRREGDHRIYSRRLVREELERKRTREWHQSKVREKDVKQEPDSRLFHSHSSSSSSSSNQNPHPNPLTTKSASREGSGLDDIVLDIYHEFVHVKKPKNRRLWTTAEKESMHGQRAIDYVNFFRSKGFEAEILPPQEKRPQ